MFSRATIAALLLLSTVPPGNGVAPPGNGAAAEQDDRETTVALTAAVFPGAETQQRELVESLLALLELNVASQPGLSVVERRQIDLALQELALSGDLGSNAAARLQLGKIVSADLMLTLELKKPHADDPTPRVLIRIVESLTGIVRGVSVAPVEEARLDEAASHMAGYLSLLVGAPEKPLVTVAVAPFESRGRFDRLRPLELGLRDLIATRLQRWSDTLAKGGDGFQVLQRSGMQELLRELELIQSGLADRRRLPTNLPSRAAAFLVRGEIDEIHAGDEYRVVVAGELVHAATNQVVRDFKFAAKPGELEAALAHEVDLLAGRLVTSDDKVGSPAGQLREVNEVHLLVNRVAADLRRFRRIRPIDFSYRDFELPTNGVPVGPPIMPANSPLGLAILKKSIERLEAALFIDPDRADAAYALGYCHGFHLAGIENAERADELLRRAAGSPPGGETGIAALRLLAEISFDHQTGRVPAGQERRAFEQMLYTLRNMPEKHRDAMWARLPSAMRPLLTKLGDPRARRELIEFAAKEAERQDSPHRSAMASAVGQLSTAWKPVDGGPDPLLRLRLWVDGRDPLLKMTAARSLAAFAERQRDLEQAAKWYLRGADGASAGTSPAEAAARDNLRIHAARCLRLAEKVDKAIELLESFQPHGRTSLNHGYYSVELGLCYLQTHENAKALDILVTAAERVPGLSDNSPVERYIEQLGGVPLSEHRDVDVQYFAGPDGKPLRVNTLATDGVTLFAPGPLHDGRSRGVWAFDVQRNSWRSLTDTFGPAVSIAVDDGELWVGTEADGIWRCDLSRNRWTRWSTEQGLPDPRVTVLTATAERVFAGVGTTAAGGVVRIDREGKVKLLDGQHAPDLAPTCLCVQGEQLLAATRSGVYEFDLQKQNWTKTMAGGGLSEVRVFPGKSHAWASCNGREIFPYQADEAEARRFQAAWFNEEGKSGVRMLFVVEHNGQLWFGGAPWTRFRSVGFYRLDPRTGEFRMYGLRDGFGMSTTYTTYAAVAIGRDLWLATSAGLARVTPRP